MNVDTRAILDRAQYAYATTNPGALGRGGVQVLLEDVPALVAELTRLRGALGFAASVIRSGEPWTATCEEVIGGALTGSTPLPF